VKHIDQRGRLLRSIPCVAGQVDGCLQARNQVVRVTEAGMEYQKASFIKAALVFRSPKRMMKIRRGIGNRLARQFPDTSSIFNHYLTLSCKQKSFSGSRDKQTRLGSGSMGPRFLGGPPFGGTQEEFLDQIAGS